MVNWWRIWRPWKVVVHFWFLTQNDEDIILFSHHTSSMKHRLNIGGFWGWGGGGVGCHTTPPLAAEAGRLSGRRRTTRGPPTDSWLQLALLEEPRGGGGGGGGVVAVAVVQVVVVVKWASQRLPYMINIVPALTPRVVIHTIDLEYELQYSISNLC